MKSSIVNKLKRMRRTLDVFNRSANADTSIDTSTSDDEDSTKRHAELQFALLELRDLLLEDTSSEMGLHVNSRMDAELAPFLMELNEICSTGYETGPY